MPMDWGRGGRVSQQLIRVALVLALGALNAACFQPLYGRQTIPGGYAVRDRLAAIEIADIPARKGTPQARVAVALRNLLVSELNGGANPPAPIYRLNVANLAAGKGVLGIDVATGNPDMETEGVTATYSLTEIATNKVLFSDSTFANASLDIPGSQQPFGEQRASVNAEDRALDVVAQNIKNRLASFFVAGT
jgi:LPS-assembly lipoprotein